MSHLLLVLLYCLELDIEQVGSLHCYIFFLGTLNTFHFCEFSCAIILNIAMCLFCFQSQMNHKMVKQKSIFLGDSGKVGFWELSFSYKNKMIACVLKVNITLSRLCVTYTFNILTSVEGAVQTILLFFFFFQ